MYEKSIKRPMWNGNWGYKESVLMVTCIFIMGVILSFTLDLKVTALAWPSNLISVLIMIVLVILVRIFIPTSSYFKWLSGRANAIVAIGAYLFLVILMGVFPQEPNYVKSVLFRSGFSHLLSSHQFLFVQIYLLFSLAMVIARRFSLSSFKEVAFAVNHLGLWITLMAIGLGAGDIQMLRMNVGKNAPVFESIAKDGSPVGDIGIALQLMDFNIDFYSPKAYIIDRFSGDLIPDLASLELEVNKQADLLDWHVSVDSVLASSVEVEQTFRPFYNQGAAPAALLTVTNHKTDEVISGWVSCGSYMYPPRALQLDDDCLLIMAEPEAKSYESSIKVFSQSGEIFEDKLTVGHPISVDGWKIYQTSYDTDKGKWSEYSVVELVRDPWIDLVYLGFILLIIGALMMIFTRKGGRHVK